MSKSSHINPRKRKISDSSDEDEIKKANEEYNLEEVFRGARSSFADMAQDLELDRSKIEKSFLLHSIARMVIYSPKIDSKYREHKERLIQTQSSEGPYTLDDESKIDTESLNIEVKNISDLLALGRLMRRSQVRSYKDMSYADKPSEVNAKIKFTSNNQNTGSDVKEDLVASYSGLGKKGFPSTDMVHLGLPGGESDYGSIRQGNQYNLGESVIHQVASSSKTASKKSDNLGDIGSKDLEDAARVITELKQEISLFFPEKDKDVYIANSIRKACKGESLLELKINTDSQGEEEIKNKQDIQDKVYALTYLLFKTEVYRSPAALISHVQMLDLIINEEMSLEDAFVDEKMPMSIKGAIKAARMLEADYKDAFYQYENPFRYAPGFPDKKRQLITKEADLMDNWIKFKFGEEKCEKMKDNIQSHLPQICEEIYGSLQNFGMNLHSPALHKMLVPNPVFSVIEEKKEASPSNSPRSSPVNTKSLVSTQAEKGSSIADL